MNMRKIAYATIIVAASMSAVMAKDDHHDDSPTPSPDTDIAVAALPAMGALLGASILSFLAIYIN